MIVFDLLCAGGHRFEGWFGSSAAFADQQARGLVACPQCSSVAVTKAPMAPSVPVKSNARAGPAPALKAVTGQLPPELVKAMNGLAKAQAKALEDSTWVGERFAEESRAMHYGEREQATIHGQATRDEAVALVDEGIVVSALPFPVAPPDEIQ